MGWPMSILSAGRSTASREDEATAARREELIKSILATQEEAMAVLRRNKERNTQVYDGVSGAAKLEVIK